jgi:cytochrome bd ubiquinol oxidase subunit II
MSLETLAAAVLFAALVAYTVFAGADFGAGFWTAFATGPRASEMRRALFNAMGPVWETNHVWLILVLVTMWTAFPPAFAAVFDQLLLPLSVTLVGIVFRGAAFAFRHFGYQEGSGLPASGLVFSAASMVTPFAMGVAVGAIAGGRVSTSGQVDLYDAWLRPFPIICGFMAVAICAFLTPFYMLIRPLGPLAEDFRRSAVAASLGLGVITTLALPVAIFDAADLADRLARPLPILAIVLAAALGITSLFVAFRRLNAVAPFVAGATVALVLGAWGVAQYPFMFLPDTRIDAVSAPEATLEAFLIALVAGAAILVPSLLLLFRLFATAPPEEAPGTN